MPSVGQDMPAMREVSRGRSRSFVARRELTTALDDSLRNAEESSLVIISLVIVAGLHVFHLMRPNMDPAPPFMLDMMLLADAAPAALVADEDSSEGVEDADVAFVIGVCTSETLVRAS